MTSRWSSRYGFVQQPGRDAGGTVGSVFGGLNEARKERKAAPAAPASSNSSQSTANSGGGNNGSLYTYTSEDQQATVGKPWKPYAELSGMGLDYDRSQYHFNNIGIREGGGSRKKRSRNVNEGAGGDEEKQQQKASGDQGVHYDPLAREFDMRPPDRQLAIGTRAARTPLNAGAQPAGALNAGPRVHATYEKTPRVTPQGPAPFVPFGELGMGQQPKTRREAGAGLGNRGRMQARTNIAHPDQGNTPANMVSSDPVPGSHRDFTPEEHNLYKNDQWYQGLYGKK